MKTNCCHGCFWWTWFCLAFTLGFKKSWADQSCQRKGRLPPVAPGSMLERTKYFAGGRKLFGSENIRLGKCFSTLKNIPYCLALRSWVYMLLSSSKIILELANLVVPFNLRLTFHRCEWKVTTKHNPHMEFFGEGHKQALKTTDICPLVCFCDNFECQMMLYLKLYNLTHA